ncbi:MAG: outer membrane beta-barrel protein [Bryobacterales bacterium]|nr:outer membrane beta-barrel protein [Bryobacterales bacterium]
MNIPALVLLALLAPAASSLRADALSVGVRGGLPFGDAFDAAESGRLKLTGRNRFLIGPTLELRLPAGLGVSFDVLYRRYRFETQTEGQTTTSGGGQWEFPLMLRYRFPGILVRPFVGAGPTLQRLTGVTSIRNNTVGLAMGAGLDIKVPFGHITPELRYSRRFQDTNASFLSNVLKANNNQFDFVVGVTF